MICPLGCGPLVPDGTSYRDNRMGLPHTVHIGWCPVCGLGVTLDAPEDLGSLYSSEYRGEEGRVPASGRLAHAWHVLNGSLPLTDIVRTGPVLDVGSNTGEALVALRGRGFEVTGLEPNPEAAEVARGYGIEVISAPIEEAELPEGRFGSILLSQVLEHVRDPHHVLRTIRPALRDDGTVFIVVPNASSLWRRAFGPDWLHWHVPFHLFHFTEESLRKLCAQCGLELRADEQRHPGRVAAPVPRGAAESSPGPLRAGAVDGSLWPPGARRPGRKARGHPPPGRRHRGSGGELAVDVVVPRGAFLPREERRLRKPLLDELPSSACRTAAAIASTEVGSKYTAASLQTSGSEAAFEDATGQPLAIASSGGSPNPSYRLGKTSAPARR